MAEIKQIKVGETTYDIGVNSHTHAAGDISSGTIAAARLPAATTSALGAVKVGTGLSVSSGTISNSGVRSVATGTSNGTIRVNTNGTSANVAVKGLGSNAYTSTAYLPLAGGTMTGTLNFANNVGISGLMAGGSDGWSLRGTGVDDAGVLALTITDNASTDYFDIIFDDWDMDPVTAIRFGGTRINSYVPFYGAVWNDYAEYRDQDAELQPGYITYCDDDGKLKYTTERLQHFEGVVSDTFGFAIGETDNCKTPLAVSGRVLVYCDPEERFHAGDCVCAGPNGIAYRMTREEIIEFPDRIVGTVSEIPTYETWGSGNVAVDGRIWIKVR